MGSSIKASALLQLMGSGHCAARLQGSRAVRPCHLQVCLQVSSVAERLPSLARLRRRAALRASFCECWGRMKIREADGARRRHIHRDRTHRSLQD